MSDLLAGDLSMEEQQALEGHRTSCDPCRDAFDRLLAQDRALAELAGEALAEDLRARIRLGLARARRTRRLGLAGAASAAALLVAAAGAWLFRPGPELPPFLTVERVHGAVFVTTGASAEPASPGSALAAGQGLTTRGASSHAAVRFADGTELALGGDSLIERIEESSQGKRARLVRGTIHADVVPQPPGRPLVLASPQARATVLGTRLRFAFDRTTRLDVEEGRARLTRAQDGASVDVAAGTYAVAEPGKPLVARPIRAAGKSVVVKAGETLALTEDLVLAGDDSLDVQGTASSRCAIEGNRHRIRTSGAWTGRLRISSCDLRELGPLATFTKEGRPAGPSHAIDLAASGDAEILIEACVFAASSSVQLKLDGRSTARVVGNLSKEDSVVWVDKAVEKSAPFFASTGTSAAPKFFQGNRIYRSQVQITGRNWTIGGEKDAESNLIIGLRAGLFATGEGTVVRGNYLHVLMPRTPEYPYWSQVATFTSAKGALAEHNVIRDGEWIVQFVEGEFRHNLICDINDHNLLRNASTGRIHHNIFVAGKPEHPPGSMSACIFIVYAPRAGEQGAEIFNNTFDAGGTMNVPGVEVNPGGFVKSLRNNVFYNFGHQEKYMSSAQAMIRPAWTEPLTEPPPDRLGYADYNLFYSPLAKTKKVYALGVAGKTARRDPGFGRNDVPRGGALDEQVDPRFRGPIPAVFAFADDDIKAGRVTVSRILEFYRAAYAPAPGSPLVDAGDPADGEGTDIGAVDAGRPATPK
jgi:ferric-dicitrate binding protein FerR (iron transport regulator)